MGAVRKLDEKTIGRIAAGEVIERPLSVLKELMENSIDAGSSEIVVELEEAGAKLIRVSDNGAGMGPDDARIAVERHTTSKIGAIEDLSRLDSLGFRGEALYSISAVSLTTIATRRAGDEVGFLLRVEGGAITAESSVARNPGTTVEVENLFYNLPARQKFLKSPRSEIQAVSQFFTQFSLAYPGVGFSLANNGVVVRTLEPVESLAERVEAMAGREIATRLEAGAGTLKRMSLEAIFTTPDFTFPNRRLQIFFVNRRLVRDRKLMTAVDVAYRGLIPGGRFPLAVLFLQVPPDEIDTNVHPAKTEIRFLREHEIHSLVYRTLRTRFVKPEAAERPALQLVQQQAPRALPEQTPAPTRQKEFALESQPSTPPETAVGTSGRNVRILGQFHDTFIFALIEGRPVFIDQHIASERIAYNRLKLACDTPHSQGLLLSEPVEVPHYVYPLLMDNIDRLKAIGIEIEPFGERAFIVRSVVHNAGAFDPLSLLVSLANELSTAPFKAPENVLLDRLLTTAACKMAVQGGRKLTGEQMLALVEEYLEQDAGRTCPHGRPIIFDLTLEVMNSWFKR